MLWIRCVNFLLHFLSLSSSYQSNAHRYSVFIVIVKINVWSNLWSPKFDIYRSHFFPFTYSKYLYGTGTSLARLLENKSYWRSLWSPILSFRLLAWATSDTVETFSSGSPPLTLFLHYTLPTASLFLQYFRKSHTRNKTGWKWIGTRLCCSYLSILWSISVIFPHITLPQIKSFYICYQCAVRNEFGV